MPPSTPRPSTEQPVAPSIKNTTDILNDIYDTKAASFREKLDDLKQSKAIENINKKLIELEEQDESLLVEQERLDRKEDIKILKKELEEIQTSLDSRIRKSKYKPILFNVSDYQHATTPTEKRVALAAIYNNLPMGQDEIVDTLSLLSGIQTQPSLIKQLFYRNPDFKASVKQFTSEESNGYFRRIIPMVRHQLGSIPELRNIISTNVKEFAKRERSEVQRRVKELKSSVWGKEPELTDKILNKMREYLPIQGDGIETKDYYRELFQNNRDAFIEVIRSKIIDFRKTLNAIEANEVSSSVLGVDSKAYFEKAVKVLQENVKTLKMPPDIDTIQQACLADPALVSRIPIEHQTSLVEMCITNPELSSDPALQPLMDQLSRVAPKEVLATLQTQKDEDGHVAPQAGVMLDRFLSTLPDHNKRMCWLSLLETQSKQLMIYLHLIKCLKEKITLIKHGCDERCIST